MAASVNYNIKGYITFCLVVLHCLQVSCLLLKACDSLIIIMGRELIGLLEPRGWNRWNSWPDFARTMKPFALCYSCGLVVTSSRNMCYLSRWSHFSFTYSFIHLFIYSFFYLFVYLFIHFFIYSFIRLFSYSFIHLII